MWNNETEVKFLEIYQTEPVLWDRTHPFHKDKRKLHDAWCRISAKTGICIEELKKKKISLMATYRGHIRDINTAMKSGAGSDEVQKPVWFAFEIMNSFLGHLYRRIKTTKTGNLNNQFSTSQDSGDSDGDFGANTTENEPNSAAGTSSKGPISVDIRESFVSPMTKRRRTNPVELCNEDNKIKEAVTALSKILQKRDAPEDDCDRYGKIFVNKLRKLPYLERMQFMWEVDGLYLKTYLKKSCPSPNPQTVPSPCSSPTPYSACSVHYENNELKK